MLIPISWLVVYRTRKCRPHPVFVPMPQTKFHYSNHDNCLARYAKCNNALGGRACCRVRLRWFFLLPGQRGIRVNLFCYLAFPEFVQRFAIDAKCCSRTSLQPLQSDLNAAAFAITIFAAVEIGLKRL